jgi:hypothetical protein
MEADWYDDESWADLKLATAGTVRGLYPNDPQWVRRWTCYAELMDAVVRHTGQDDEIYDEVANYHLRIYHELLDPELFATSRASMGKSILSSLKQVIERLTQDDGPLEDSIADAATRAYSREVILGWHYALEYHGNWKAAARQWYLAAKPQRVQRDSAVRVMQDRIWRHGLARPDKYPANSAAALRLMTRAFDDAFRQYMYMGAGDDADVLGQLLPACFAERVRGDAEYLKEKRSQYSPEEQRTLGIDENGYTTLMADALPRLRGCIARKESMLVLGPTSSGKSRIGRIAVCHAITRAHKSHGRAIVLLPTKALVNQAADEWREFVKGTYAEQWHILAGSRDYPQNDEAIARREFEIAVMIPEKLAGLMAGGMTLDGIDIVIVDELQNLADEERGPRLEMLLTTIRANYRIPLIGLSATLSPQAIEDVAAWLGIDGESIVTTRMRPVPLDYIVCDDSQAMVRSADGAEASRNLDLRSMLRAWRDDEVLGSRMESGQIKTYRRALALAATLLRGDGGMDGESRIHSVLCFVGSREDAQRMADIAQTVLDQDPRTPHVDPGANPFKGRFSDLSDDEAKRRYRDFQRYPQTRLRDSVAKSLRTGVGYHTARLDPEMRVEMEEAFRIGLVRLLFATDTLKLGINLPADAVVIASITTPTGESRSRVLNQIDVAQRLGRAGRLGHGLGLRGYGYLVVPEQRPAKTRIVFEEHDMLGLAEMVQPATDHESELDRALRALVDVDAVFKHYIGHIGDALLGASINSRVTEGWFAAEILHWAVREGVTFTRDELSHRIDALYQASLGRVTGVPAPDHGNVPEFLEKHALIGPAPGTAPGSGALVVTGLGRAISTSSLPFDDAPVVEELMQSGMDGAGDLTLLWLATKSGHVRKTTTWISIMREGGTEDPKIEGLQRERFHQLARVIAAPPGERAGLATFLSNSAFLKWLPNHDLIGEGTTAEHLRRLIYGPGPEPEAAEINALLRACALMLWKSGCPFKEIEDALQTNLEVAVKALGTRTVLIHPQDVRMLGENASYLFDAARELTGVRPQGTLFRRFEALGESVEFGVPAAIAPLVRLPLRGATHRERVVGLVGLMKNDPSIGRFDSLADVVDRYMRRPKDKPPDPAAADRLARFTLTDQERREVRKALNSFESRRWKGTRLPRELRRRNVPGNAAYSLEQALEQLRRLDLDNTPKQAALIMRRYGLQATEDPEDGLITLTSVLRPELSVRMLVRTSIVTVRDLDAARGYADVILACAGATGGVQSAELSSKGGNPVVLQPSILLQAADSVTRIVGPAGSGDGPDMPLASDYEYVAADEETDVDDEAADAESDDDVWEPELDDWDEPGSTPAGAQPGFELVGHRLLQLLIAAPPILARNELNRLIAGMTVAAPPALHDDLMVGSDDSDPANLPDEATNGEMP